MADFYGRINGGFEKGVLSYKVASRQVLVRLGGFCPANLMEDHRSAILSTRVATCSRVMGEVSGS